MIGDNEADVNGARVGIDRVVDDVRDRGFEGVLQADRFEDSGVRRQLVRADRVADRLIVGSV